MGGKPPIVPKAKMKALHWKKLNKAATKNTLWAQVDDEAVDIDEDELVELFGVSKDEEERAARRKAQRRNRAAPGAPVSLIDMKRSNNLSIALSRFRLEPDALVDAIVHLEPIVAAPENIKALIKNQPTADEMRMFQAFKGDVTALGNAELTLMALARIPHLDGRLDAMLTRSTFVERQLELEDDLDAVIAGAEAVVNSDKLAGVLELILALGNYINGSTRRGGAYGFALSDLPRIVGTKGKGGTTLMAYVERRLRKVSPELSGFPAELAPVAAACRANVQAAESGIGKLGLELQRVEQTLAAVKGAAVPVSGDRFVSVFESWAAEAAGVVASLRTKLEQLQDNVAVLRSYMGESDSTPTEELFAIVSNFVELFSQAVKANAALERPPKSAKPAKRGGGGGGAGGSGPRPPPVVQDGAMDLLAEMQGGAFFQKLKARRAGSQSGGQ